MALETDSRWESVSSWHTLHLLYASSSAWQSRSEGSEAEGLDLWAGGRSDGKGELGRGLLSHPCTEPSTAVWGLCLEMGVGKGRDSRPPTFPSLNSPKAGQLPLSLMPRSQGWMCSLSLPPDCLTAPSVPPPVSGCEAALVLSPQYFQGCKVIWDRHTQGGIPGRTNVTNAVTQMVFSEPQFSSL